MRSGAPASSSKWDPNAEVDVSVMETALRILRECFPNNTHTENMRLLKLQTSCLYIEGALEGLLMYRAPDEDVCVIEAIAIDTQKEGHGKLLMAAWAEYLVETENVLTVYVQADTNAIGFYEKMGFTPMSRTTVADTSTVLNMEVSTHHLKATRVSLAKKYEVRHATRIATSHEGGEHQHGDATGVITCGDGGLFDTALTRHVPQDQWDDGKKGLMYLKVTNNNLMHIMK